MTTKAQRQDRTGPAPPSDGAPPRRRRPTWLALRTFVVVVALLAAAVTGGGYLTRMRLAAATMVDLGAAVLTAEAVPVGSADAGVVTDVAVAPQARVVAGQELARVTLTANGTNPDGSPRPPQIQVLRAPTAGTVSTVDVVVGGVARAGEPVITLYDQSRLTFQAPVPVRELRALRLGMAVSVNGPGLGAPVSATLDHVVPRVGGDPVSAGDRLTVVLVPTAGDVERVSRLVPGLRFTATVDTKTAAGGTPAVNSGG
jgi:multidrug resistance efflux pump